MCKISENGEKCLPTSRESPRAMYARQRNGLRFRFASLPARLAVVRQWQPQSVTAQRAGLGAWPVAFHAEPSQTLLCS